MRFIVRGRVVPNAFDLCLCSDQWQDDGKEFRSWSGAADWAAQNGVEVRAPSGLEVCIQGEGF